MRYLVILLAVVLLCRVSVAAPANTLDFSFRGHAVGERDMKSPGQQLVDLVRRTIEPESWDKEHTVSYRRGYLAVTHEERVHQKVQSLLDLLRGETTKP